MPSLSLSFSFEYAVSEEIEKLSNEGSISLINNPGFGIDFGVTIEKIDPDNPEMYKYKFGFAVTDLGMLKHESSSNSSFNQVTVENLSFNRLRNLTTIDQLFDTINSLANITQEKSGKKGNRLPMTLSLQYDQHIGGPFYAHVAMSRHTFYLGTDKVGDLSFTGLDLVARFEKSRYGIYMPFQYNKYINWRGGIALRWRPFVIGSNNLFNSIFDSGDVALFDLYFLTRIRIKGKKRQ